MDLFQQLKSQPLWYLFLLAIGFFSILNSFYSILTRLYANFRRPPTNLTRPTDSASTSASASTSTAESVVAATVYEVFLSFRGEDTRKGITDYLYHDLVGASIQTFRDNDKLKVGEQIGPELLKAIKESKISIPIFSKNYASSKWCLLELKQIVECHKNGGHKIFPIFYDVDPSDVRNQRGSYELAFRLHEKKFDESTVRGWRDALKVVGELKGLELKNETDGHEGEFVKKVVEKVVMELNKNYTDVPRNLVGMHKHIDKLMVLLEVDSDDVRIVGIHGMGGSGKTTMTKVIYNQMCNNFDGQSFFDNVREKSKDDNGFAEMQNRISSVSDGRNCGKKLLLVLDDVDDYIQIDRLMEELNRFGAGSRIILTTRNKEVLDKIENILQREDPSVVCTNYKPDFMDNSDSLQLFSKYAFKKDFPIEEYKSLSEEVVNIAAGLPLALVVFGSTFFAFDKDIWVEKVSELREMPHEKVLEKLMFSFKALRDTEKEIYLDIACLFIGDKKTRPTYMWEACRLRPKLGIHVLVSRSLITIDDKNRFHMHDQLRDLGREIVRQEGLQGKQSRLWCSEEASRVLERNQGTSFVNALPLQSHNSVVARHFHLLPNLRYLRMKEVRNVDGDFKDLLPNLRWLECENMLDNSFLRNFNMKNLVVLDLSYNNKLTDEWDGWRQLEMANNLKVLDLSYCRYFQTLPNLSNLTKLVELRLSGCDKLVEIQGLEKLEFLQVLKINGCWSLRRIPNISSLKDLKVFEARDCSNLSQIEGLGGLISLEYLDLLGCNFLEEGLGYLSILNNLQVLISGYGSLYFPNFKKLGGCDSLEEGLEDLSNLNKLQVLKGGHGLLDLTTDLSIFKKLKHLEIYKSNRNEIQNLDGLEALEYLDIFGCSSMVRLPNLSYLNRLKTLKIWMCEQLIEIPDLSELKSLEELTISWCSSVKALPDLSPLQKLKKLQVYSCTELSEIPGIEELKSLESLTIRRCWSVKALPDLSALQILRKLDVNECVKLSEIPGIEELKCLIELDITFCEGLGHLLELDLPNVRIISEIGDYNEYSETVDYKTYEYLEIEEYPTDENTEDSDIEEYPTDENTED